MNNNELCRGTACGRAGEDASNLESEYEGTEKIEPCRLSTAPATAGILSVDSGTNPRVAAPPSPPMPTSGRSPRRPLPPFCSPHSNNSVHAAQGKGPKSPDELEAVRARSAFKSWRGRRRGRDRVAHAPGRRDPDAAVRSRSTSVSAGAAPGDSWPADAGACGSAARAVAARCEAVNRSCCKFPAARPARAASSRARDIRESNTAPSNRADIASSSLAVRVNRIFRREKRPVKQAGLCAGRSSVSRGIYTISRGMVSGACDERFSRAFVARISRALLGTG